MFNRKKIRELEEEVLRLQGELAATGALSAVELRDHIAELSKDRVEKQADLADLQRQIESAKKDVIEIDDQKILQDVGIYQFRHPLASAQEYEERLDHIQQQRKDLVRTKNAITAASDWRVNNSLREGSKMTNQVSRLMLEAYNASLENTIRTLKPYTLDRAIERMNKVKERVEKNGQVLGVNVTSPYHNLAIRELELVSDYQIKKEQEREALREERAKEREERQARVEYAREKKKLEKERELYLQALAKLAVERAQERAEIEAKIGETDKQIEAVANREANIRTGFVYVISNVGSLGPDMIKIGLTRRLDPIDRVKELSDASVPFPFDIHALIFSHDAVSLEREIHERLEPFRVNLVNSRREYFYSSPEKVRGIIEELGTEYLLEFQSEVEAYEWRESGASKRRAELEEGAT